MPCRHQYLLGYEMLFNNNLPRIFFLLAFSLSVLHGQGSIDSVISRIRTDANGIILYNLGKARPTEINAVIENKNLLGWNIHALGFDGTPDNLIRLNIELSWDSQHIWSFYYLGNKVGSGSELPTADDLKSICENSGIPNQIVRLKTFLASNPNNLDAKSALMGELYENAYQKTGRALSLVSKNVRDDPMLMLTANSTIAPQATTERLGEEADADIWGDLAALFNASFSSGEWLQVLPEFFFHRRRPENRAVYSPTMKAVYQRNISRVERELESRPNDNYLWSVWLEMSQATGRRAREFFPNISPFPVGSPYPWPPVRVSQWIVQEARAAKDWAAVIEFLWPDWPGTQLFLNMFAPVNSAKSPSRPEELAVQKDYVWNRTILPLLEASLQEKEFDKATDVYFDLLERPLLADKAILAAELAKSHKYAFPAAYTRSRPLPENEMESFIGDPVVGNSIRFRPIIKHLADLCRTSYLSLLTIDPSESNQAEPFRQQVRSLLAQGGLPEFGILFLETMAPDHPAARELIDREGLADGTFFWGILDDGAKYYHGGNSAPTLNRMMDVVGSINKKTRLQVFKEYAKDNPDSVAAKTILLGELASIGNLRTSNAGKDKDDLLDNSADYEIWRDFVYTASDAFTQLLQCADDMPIHSFRSLPIKNSRLLQQFAARHTQPIEQSLRDRPHSSQDLWELWAIFSPFLPNSSLTSFLASLTPVPVPGLPSFPPASLYPQLISNYQSLGSWWKIIELTEPVWESYQNLLNANENIKHRLTSSLWNGYISPLCGAYEKIGQDQKSEKIRLAWKKAEGWAEPGRQ
jgi:hypothetical protein